MIPAPVAMGLFLCEQVIVDRRTNNPSPINIFTGLAVERFPSEIQRFSVFAALTDGQGEGTIELAGHRMDSGELVYSQRHPIRFVDRRLVVNVDMRVRNIRFPVAGAYEFVLLVDGDLVARRALRVYRQDNPGS